MKWIFLTLIVPAALLSQNIPNWDTTHYQKFNSKLIFGFFQGYQNFNNKFTYLNHPDKLASYVSISADSRFTFGLNRRRAYIIWTSMNDFTLYSKSVMKRQNRSLGGTFSWGCRFKGKTSEFYKNFQKTKLYSNP
jgi:hypothetical protein